VTTVPATAQPGGDAATAAPARLAVVVVNYGSSELLARNLAALDGLPDTVVVVVDNRTTAAEQDAVVRLAAGHGWAHVLLPDNRGFGAAANAGAREAHRLGCTSYLFLNPDAVVAPEVVAELHRHSTADPLALVTPVLVTSADTVFFAGADLSLADGRLRGRRGPAGQRRVSPALRGATREWLTAACLVVHSTVFDRIGGFDERYFLYWEDVDLSLRAVDAGAHLVLREDLTALHDEGGTQGRRRSGAKSDGYYRWNCRNRLVLGAARLGRRELLGWLLRTPAASWEILLRGGRRQLLHSPRPLLAAVRGSLSGATVAVGALLRGAPAPAAVDTVLVAHPGAELYGSDRVLLESVTALARDRRVVVVLPQGGPLVAELEARGAVVETCAMPVLRKAALRPSGALRLAADACRGLLPAVRLVWRHGRGGVYVSTLTIPSWVVLSRLLRRPVLCHVHEAESTAPRPVRRAMAVGPLLADSVVVNSRYSLAVLADVAPAVRRRSTVVYNGVPGPDDVVPAREQLTGPVRLLFIGRLSPRKGPQVAVAALAELVARGLDARLDLLGSVFDGYEWFAEELHDLVRDAGLTDRVEFLGFRSEIWPVLAASDVVLIPSVGDEPFGNTAVEAVLAARPLVVSAGSGLQEAADGYPSAQAVAPGEAGLWADAVQRVVATWPTRRHQALEDAAAARHRHDPRAYQDRLHRVMAELADPVRAGAGHAVEAAR
jgi:GT2 family glycosyltransferase